jgi:hypothetical protein
MSLTTDPKDPELGQVIDEKTNTQNKKYLVLSEEELTKGFIRPVREKYVHVGKKIERDEEGRIIGRLIKIDESEYPKNEYYTAETGFGGYIMYPKDYGKIGRYLSTKEVKAIVDRKAYFSGCGVETKMDITISETYARDPKFYGATYCVGCQKHLPVNEFEWSKDGETVGS